jgi:hypothetical protein
VSSQQWQPSGQEATSGEAFPAPAGPPPAGGPQAGSPAPAGGPQAGSPAPAGGSPAGSPAPAGGSPAGTPAPARGPQAGYGVKNPGPKPLWKARQDGKTVFRHVTPLVLWWGWAIFAVANFVDLAVTDHNFYVFKVTGLLLLVTGIMYACTVHSRVEADEQGVSIFNPVRSHHAGWGAVEGIYLGDSVEFSCVRPAPKKPKTIYSWALYSRRRSQARTQMQRNFFSPRRTSSMRAPAEAAELASQPAAKIMAAELGRRALDARDHGAVGGVLESRWAVIPLAAMIIPAVLLIVVLLIR